MEHRRYYDLMRWKEGKCINQPIYGIYVNGAGGIDFTGDGREDVVFYANGGSKPAVGAGVQTYEIGKDIILSRGFKGIFLQPPYTGPQSLLTKTAIIFIRFQQTNSA